jgi:DNA mismatch repair protein MutL
LQTVSPRSGQPEITETVQRLQRGFDQAEADPSIVEHPLGAARTQIHENYIVAQTRDGLVIVDQHAAHERLVFERFKTALRSGKVASQILLLPEIIDLPEDDCDRLAERAGDLAELGLVLERFGPGAIAVRETPSMLGETDIGGLVRDLADEIAEWDSSSALRDRLEAVASTMACHGSVRSGRRLVTREKWIAVARNGAHTRIRAVQSRPADLYRAQAQRYRETVLATLTLV